MNRGFQKPRATGAAQAAAGPDGGHGRVDPHGDLPSGL